VLHLPAEATEGGRLNSDSGAASESTGSGCRRPPRAASASSRRRPRAAACSGSSSASLSGDSPPSSSSLPLGPSRRASSSSAASRVPRAAPAPGSSSCARKLAAGASSWYLVRTSNVRAGKLPCASAPQLAPPTLLCAMQCHTCSLPYAGQARRLSHRRLEHDPHGVVYCSGVLAVWYSCLVLQEPSVRRSSPAVAPSAS